MREPPDGAAVRTHDERAAHPGAFEMSPWLMWAVAASSAVFFAWVVLPAGFLLADLLRPGAATLSTRLDALRLLYVSVLDPSAYRDDPLRTIPAAIGFVALLVFIGLLAAVAARAARDGRRAWPAAVVGSGVPDGVVQVATIIAMVAVAGQSIVQPVPARPTDWWFLLLALGSVTAWLSRRRPGMVLAAAILCGSALIAIGVDLVGPGEGLWAPGSGWEVLALAGAAVATIAALRLLLPEGGRLGSDGDARPGWGDPRPGVVIGIAAAVLGLLAITISAAGCYDNPAAVFGERPAGMRVVVLSPHIDDEAAFAGETIAWLTQHGAHVTVVYATDSRGGRALDKQPAYVASRRAVSSGALRTLGVAKTVTLDGVRDGNRMREPRKVAAIIADVAARGLVDSRTVLISVSGTGHSDHLATFQAASVIAAKAGIPLVVAWGYDRRHEVIGIAEAGVPHPIDGGALALWKKAAATDDYIALYEDSYPFTLPRVLLTARGSHDTLSVIRVPSAGSASEAASGVLR
jgi:LmbE family N-acetylglucosaminyl deacetylase